MQLKEIVPEYRSKNPFVRKLFLNRLDSAIKLVGDDKSILKKIIDLGCGEGTLLKILEKRFKNADIFGIDIEPNVLDLKDFTSVEIKVVDLRKTGYPDNFFDLAFCLDVLEHFENLEAPVREIIIKPDGLLVVSLPTENNLYKLCRLILKGTTSSKKGPCSSPHFFGAGFIENFIASNGFQNNKKIVLPSRLLPLFDLVLFRKQ